MENFQVFPLCWPKREKVEKVSEKHKKNMKFLPDMVFKKIKIGQSAHSIFQPDLFFSAAFFGQYISDYT